MLCMFASWIWRNPLSGGRQEQQASGGGGGGGVWCPPVHTSLSLSAILPSLPSHGLCLWLNAGILSQRLAVAKRERAPEKLGKCMWVTASQKGAFHSPLPSFFLLLFVPLFFSGSLARSLHPHQWKVHWFVSIPFIIPPNEPLRQGPIRYGDVSYWLINFSLCAHTSLSVSLCVWLVFLTHGQTKRSARRGRTPLKRI